MRTGDKGSVELEIQVFPARCLRKCMTSPTTRTTGVQP
jgi:hypothetical protein